MIDSILNGNNKRPPKILLVTLELQDWKRARPWSYTGHLGFEEGLKNIGVDCTVLPILAEVPTDSPYSWQYHAPKLFQNQSFDQIWIWLVHANPDPKFMDWVKHAAPVRVGVVCESLRYYDYEIAEHPVYGPRWQQFLDYTPYLTHALVFDEADEIELNRLGAVNTLFIPQAVPQQYIEPLDAGPTNESERKAVFYGSLYGKRQRFLEHPFLKQHVTFPQQPVDSAEFAEVFDQLQATSLVELARGPVSLETLQKYISCLRSMRQESFRNWLSALKQWLATVNLPSYFKGHAGRVVESMAAGRPVLTWKLPERPRTNGLFNDGTEILLYEDWRPEQLAEKIVWLKNDPTAANSIAGQAREKVLRLHTMEQRMKQVLKWIESGVPLEQQLPQTRSEKGMAGQGYESFLESVTEMVERGDVSRALTALETGCSQYPEHGEIKDIILKLKAAAGISIAVASSPELTATPESHAYTEAYYEKLFSEDPAWSSPQPNEDEAARWEKISGFIDQILRDRGVDGPIGKILDVGCGRGWLVNKLSKYGEAEGIEPVAPVIRRARQLFPQFKFHVGLSFDLIKARQFKPFDLVVSSEVIEHVEDKDKQAFVASLRELLNYGGHAIITTPRKESFDLLRSRGWNSTQPVEAWLTEDELKELFSRNGLVPLRQDRIFMRMQDLGIAQNPQPEQVSAGVIFPIYQLWCFKAV